MVDLFDDDDTLIFMNVVSTGSITISNPSSGVYSYDFNSPSQGDIFSFKIIADDLVSTPTELSASISVASWASEWTKCFGPTADEWYACAPGNALEVNSCSATCPLGKYSEMGVWQDCHEYCETCTGGGNDRCTSCKGMLIIKKSSSISNLK